MSNFGRTCLNLSLALLCPACSLPPSPPHISQAACDVALLYAKAFKARARIPIAVWLAPAPSETGLPTREGIEEALRLHPELNNDPELPLLRLSTDLRDISVVQKCPALQKWWDENSTVHSDILMQELAKSMPPLGMKGRTSLPFGLLALSVPAVSDDGTVAYFFVAEATRTDGGRFTVTYNKSVDGNWHISRKAELGVP